MKNKKALQLELYHVKSFDRPSIKAEQYMTPAEIAADLLWKAFMLGDIEAKVVADLGAGTGMLGIGCLLLGAQKVWFVEQDAESIKVLHKNLTELEEADYQVSERSITSFSETVDMVIMNPPFGTKEKHADKFFLKKAIEVSPVIYSFHKAETIKFLQAFARTNELNITHIWKYKWPLLPTMEHHTKKISHIDVVGVRIERKKEK